MDTPSNGEVVEGCLVNIERNGDVSAFATEFIRYAANQHLPATVLFACSQWTNLVAPHVGIVYEYAVHGKSAHLVIGTTNEVN